MMNRTLTWPEMVAEISEHLEDVDAFELKRIYRECFPNTRFTYDFKTETFEVITPDGEKA